MSNQSEYGHLEPHAFAGIFDLIRGCEFDELVASVKENGVREPIVLFEGKVLDGRNRLRAAIAAGISSHAVPMREFNPSIEGSAMAFVWDANVNRRHLDEAQLALAAAERATIEWGSNQFLRTSEEGHVCTSSVPTQKEAAAAVGVSVRSVKQATIVRDGGTDELKDLMRAGNVSLRAGEAIARLDEEKQKAVIAAARAVAGKNEGRLAKALQNEVKKAACREKHEETADGNRKADPDGVKYDVCIADPPWKYDNEDINGAAHKHYATMPIREICEWSPVEGVPVRELFMKKSVLFMWTTVQNVWRRGLAYGEDDELAGNARDVADAWGFPDFRGCFVWCKPKLGTGYWVRNQYEHLAIFTRGNFPAPPTDLAPLNVLQGDDWPVGEHSTKPGETYRLIERMTPGDYRRVEFFARSSAPGWKGFGNQVPSQK